MQHQKIIETIEASNPYADWKYVQRGSNEVRYYVGDVNLRLETTFDELDIHNPSFKEPWTDVHPDQNATSYFYNLYYGATLIQRFIFVAVDGARAMLPLPNPTTKKISPLNYKVAQILDGSDSLDDYIKSSGLSVA
jgi:hypothetical protein